MRTELRGVWMAGKPAEEQINNTGWGFYLNSNNLVLHEAETRMNTGFAGGGVSNFKPHKAFTYIIQKCNRLNVLSSYSLNVFKRNTS